MNAEAMTITAMAEEAISQKAESERLKKASDELSRKVREAILNRAKEIVEQSCDLPSSPGKQLECVVAEWTDEKDRFHQIICRTYFGALTSKTYTEKRPSGRLTSTQSLSRTPLEHLSEHFGPLMS